jgi:hypothetical protein
MKNRAAWGMAVVLAVLLAGGTFLGARYWKGLPSAPWRDRIIWLPRNAWSFERTRLILLPGNHPPEEWQSLGFIMVRVK